MGGMKDLFGDTPYVPPGIAARDRGMARASDNAERSDPGFGEKAVNVLRDLATKQDTVHIDDFLRATDLRPSSPNAMGAVWVSAIKRGIIKHSGRVKNCVSDDKKHRHKYPIYDSMIFKP